MLRMRFSYSTPSSLKSSTTKETYLVAELLTKQITEQVMDTAVQTVMSQCELRTDEWNGCVTILPLLCAIMQRHERSMIWMSAKEQNRPKTNASSQ